MALKVIITGTTGMVGEGVLLECLDNPSVEKVLSLSRKPVNIKHEKLVEILHTNFLDISSLSSQLTGYDACFFCLGVSSIGMKEDAYTKLTYDLTMHVASVLSEANKNTMTFCYVSGSGTDSSEKGGRMWARVKGKTENDLMKLPFKSVYNFRPGGLIPTKGQQKILPFYKYLAWLIHILAKLAPNTTCTIKDMGIAMIHVCENGYARNIITVKDIHILAKE